MQSSINSFSDSPSLTETSAVKMTSPMTTLDFYATGGRGSYIYLKIKRCESRPSMEHFAKSQKPINSCELWIPHSELSESAGGTGIKTFHESLTGTSERVGLNCIGHRCQHCASLLCHRNRMSSTMCPPKGYRHMKFPGQPMMLWLATVIE